MHVRQIAAAVVAVCVVLTACSVSTDTSGTVGVPTSAPVPTAEPLGEPTDVPEQVGPCGPTAFPSSQAVLWVNPDGPAPDQAMLDELATREPSDSFNVFDLVVAVDLEDPSQKYVLGPAWSVEVVSVEPVEVGGTCSFSTTFTSGGLNVFNEIAVRCFEQAPECPTMRLAVLVDGQVVMNPTVQSPVFSEPEISITTSQGFDLVSAAETAQAIADGAQFRPVLLGPIPR